MSTSMNDGRIHAAPDMVSVSPLVPPRPSAHESEAVVVRDESSKKNMAEKPSLEVIIPNGESDLVVVPLDQEEQHGTIRIEEGNDPSVQVVLVDYEENDPESPLN